MASLGSEPGGRRRILVVGRDGRRRTIRLGKMTLKAARTALAHVEALAAARISGAGIPAATAQWLGGLPLAIHKRLVKAGLCEPRPEGARSAKPSITRSVLKTGGILLSFQCRGTYLQPGGAVGREKR